MKEQKQKRKTYYAKFTEKEYEDFRNEWFKRGVEAGKKEIQDKIIELLGLDDRYEIYHEDY